MIGDRATRARGCVPLRLFAFGCSPKPGPATGPARVATLPLEPCTISADDVGWFARSVDAWQHTRERHLLLPPDTLPPIILFDRRCVYHVDVGSAARGGADFNGALHHGLVRLPNERSIGVRAIGLTSATRDDSSVFVALALADVWRTDPQYRTVTGSWHQYLTGAFIHEMTHARTVRRYLPRLREMSPTMFPDSIRDDVVQDRFADDPVFAASVNREIDLLYRSALSPGLANRVELARSAVDLLRARRARTYVGDLSEWGEIEQTFLDIEGVAQWAAFTNARTTFHRRMAFVEALERFRSGEQYWSQDEGLALFLALDALDVGWQQRFFATPPVPGGALALLERALQQHR